METGFLYKAREAKQAALGWRQPPSRKRETEATSQDWGLLECAGTGLLGTPLASPTVTISHHISCECRCGAWGLVWWAMELSDW